MEHSQGLEHAEAARCEIVLERFVRSLAWLAFNRNLKQDSAHEVHSDERDGALVACMRICACGVLQGQWASRVLPGGRSPSRHETTGRLHRAPNVIRGHHSWRPTVPLRLRQT